MDYAAESLRLHYEWRGKLDTVPKMEVKDRESLSLAYTPGVAQPCLEIKKDIDKSYELTGRWNTAAVVTDGTAVLGLGDIGPEAGMPVMEGKCVLFKAFGGVNAVPLCVRTKDVDEIVNTVALLAGSFGGVNLEDISAPRCFEIERRLQERCDIPIFHDDQHGTAIIVAAALTNALKLVGKRLEDVKLVMSGAGAAGTAIYKLLRELGLRRAVLCDIRGIVYPGRPDLKDDPALAELAEGFRFYAGHITDFYDEAGTLLLSLPPVERWEVDIDALQPSQFSVDEDKCAAVDTFLHTAADLVIPVTELADGTLCTMDGHTRLYAAWRKGIRRAMVFRASDQDMAAGIADFAAEARKRGIFHIRDMALLSHEEQEEQWDGWCDAYFARQAEGK